MSNTIDFKLPTLEELLHAGVHFGHKKSGWNPKMQQYIHAERNGVHIIDLIATMELLKTALEAMKEASEKGNLLIVGTKGQAASLVESMAIEAGFFYVNKRWPGGLFTNFKAIKKSIDKLISMEETLANGAEGMVKKEQLLMQREVERLNKVYAGIKFMDKMPTMMVVIDSKVEKNAIKEAINAGIPVVALLDTNSDPDVVNYPIPANDDSLKSITLFLEVFNKTISKGIKASALVSLRKEYSERLTKMKADYDYEIERKRVMAETEKDRIKALKVGLEVNEVKFTPKVEKEVVRKIVVEKKVVAKAPVKKAVVKKAVAKKTVVKKTPVKKAAVKKTTKKVTK